MKAQALLVSGKSDEALVAAKQAVSMAKAMDDKPLEQLAQEILDKVLQGQAVPAAAQQPTMTMLQLEEEEEETPVAAAASESSQPEDLDPEVGRFRGQEILAMLADGPLSKGSSVREPPGLRQTRGPRSGAELLSTAVPSQTFSQPWIPLGTAFGQGNRTSHPNGFAL
eukprot:g3979.t1